METNSLAFKMFLLKKDPGNLQYPLEFQKRSICKYKYNSNICKYILARLNYWRHAKTRYYYSSILLLYVKNLFVYFCTTVQRVVVSMIFMSLMLTKI